MSTLVLSLLMIGIGLALVVQVISGGASAVSARMILGVLFVAAGVGRTYVEVRRGRKA